MKDDKPNTWAKDHSKQIEALARAMRATVYGGDCTQKNWEACRDNWMRPDSMQWLTDRMKGEFEKREGARFIYVG